MAGSSMSERKVLFVVEGEKGEPRFLTKMHQLLLGTKPGNIYSCGFSIHRLLKKMFTEGRVDENLDIVSVLREDASEEDRRMLDQDFSDVYLVFDMDPHDTLYDDVRLLLAMDYFSDSTNNGKLYLNYPMLESYKHLCRPFDEDYIDRTVPMDSVKSYKELVDGEAYPGIKDLGKYTEDTGRMIVMLNLRKVNRILTGSSDVPSVDAYRTINLAKVLELQRELLQKERLLYVLNTSVLNVVDFNPTMFTDCGEIIIDGSSGTDR